MITSSIVIFIVLIMAGMAYLASIKGEYTISRSRLVSTDIETAFNTIANLRTWPTWSPWLMHEPEASLSYSESSNEVGSYYSWNGQFIGAGKLTHASLNSPQKIECQLEFTRPYKSICSVGFEIEKAQEQTKVSWIMNGKMPFLFRFMIPKIKKMIAKDYELGLAMLSGHINSQASHPTLDFHGINTEAPMQCLCESFACDLASMQELMQAGFPKLNTFVSDNNIGVTGSPISVYHKVNQKKMFFIGEMAIPVHQDVMDTGPYELKQVGGGQYFKVSLTGSYEFLELAWHAAYAHLYMKKIKPDFKRSSYEVYETDPELTSNTNEILTSLYIPTK